MPRTCITSPISLILIFLVSTDLSILLDIHVFRQILGFIFLAFVPGTLFLCIIKPDKLGLTEKFVLSVGLSISFIMFAGLLINTLFPIFGYRTPLSAISLVISLTAFIIILAFAACKNGQFSYFIKRADLKLDLKDKAFILIPLFFPMLSILGMHMMNATGNNAILMALLFLIPGYVIFISICDNQVTEKAYPLVIFLSSISLVLLLGMRSSHIIGVDAHLEYYLFQQTLSNGRWQIFLDSTVDSCLSVSILPAIYQSFININPEYLFKILYPCFFSIAPLVVFLISKKYIGNIYAFLASLFFMSQVVFLTTAANPRTTVAILFFALSILVLFNSKLAELEKRLLFLIFILSCVVSHYSTTFIFFIVLLFTFICVKVICGLIAYQRRSAIKKNPLADELNITSSTSKITVSRTYKTYLTLGILVLFFVVVFLWYSQVTGAAFNNGVGFIAKSLKSMQNLFILESRDGNVAKAFGYGIEEMQVVRKASFIFNWLTIISIVIGVLTTLVMYRQRVALPYENEYGPSGFLSKRIDIEFLSLSLVCFFVMVASVVVPNISRGYGIDRAYMQMAVSLSLFFIIGAITAARFIHVKRVYLVVLIILIPFFMCTTGTLSQIFGYPQQIILNSDGPQYNLYYIHEQEAYACRWLGQQIEVGKLCYADTIGRSRLISQGGIRIDHIGDIASFLAQNRNSSGYIYLRYLNVVEGKFVSSISAGEQESSKSWYRFSEKDKILDCGGSEIWR